MKDLLRVTHIDLDGVSPYLLDRFYNPHYLDEDYMFINYGEEFKVEVKEGEERTNLEFKIPKDYDRIVVTDLGLTKPWYEFLKENYPGKYVWMDHHLDSGENKDPDDDKIIFDSKRSGTKIYFDYLTAGKRKNRVVNDFVNLVDTYDQFKTTHPLWEDAQNMNRLLYGSANWRARTTPDKFKFFVRSQLSKFHTQKRFFFTDDEHIIIQRQIEKEDAAYDSAYAGMQIREDNLGYKFGLIQCGSKVSIVCSRLLENENLDYIICINTYQGINGRMHLRINENNNLTKDNFDGFNGHAKAAGGSLDKSQIVKLWNGKLNYEVKEVQ